MCGSSCSPHDVEYSTEVDVVFGSKGHHSTWHLRRGFLRLLELPVTFQRWDNAVLRDAKALVAYFERETERLKEAAR